MHKYSRGIYALLPTCICVPHKKSAIHCSVWLTYNYFRKFKPNPNCNAYIDYGQLYFNFSATTLHSFLKNAIVAFLCLWMHSFRRHEWTWMQRFRATSRDPSPNRPMSSLGQHFSQINLKKKQKNKPYKAFSRFWTDLSLVGLNSLLYMFFLRPPAERCFPSLS